MVQLQGTSQPAASPELPPYGSWHATPVCGNVPLGAGHSHLSTAGPLEPPTSPGRQTEQGLPTHVPPAQGVSRPWSPAALSATRG